MHISKASARDIVDEISKLVKQNVNLMNEKGIIIASCDKERIGQFHEGAFKIITEKLDEYYIDDERATETAKKGLNFPLELDGEIVGVVGITGSYDEVINQGRLLQKMTEILLQEHRRSYHQLMDKRIKNAFMEEWLIRTGYVNDKDLEERGQAIKIDINRPRRILIASVDELDSYKETQEGQSKIQKMENRIGEFLKNREGAICFRDAMRQVILVDRVSTEELIRLAQEMASYVCEKEKLELNIGIDGADTNMRRAYLQAHRAWRMASDERKPVVCYENLNLELLLSVVPTQTKEEYMEKIFKGCTEAERKAYIAILHIYFKEDGSIQKTADAMYIHKNTLQYRLNKIKEVTGYDVRKPSESVPLYIAMRMAYDAQN
ncbi:MAG: sugar diacid recognition domain-containing protein [Eubacteriales bacterium]|nr:sugar diacid recognition domain-containing protein [Eubacteriales bacterium]